MVRWSTRLAYPVVFLSGFLFFLLEITAGRLLAPAIGFSLETWTGIIGVVLAGQAVGDTIGGRVVDRTPRPMVLGATLVGAGLAVLIMPMLSVGARGLLTSAPIMVRVIVTAALVLFLPSTLLAAVSPIATRLTLRAVERTGRTVGRLSAVSTVGSVLGVVIGGFILLQEFGVRAIVFSCGAILLLLGALVATAREAVDARDVGVDGAATAAGATATPNAWALYVLPFVAGGAIMAVELAGARLAAMLFGTSLYTWASTIGTVLLGLSLGTALGGWLACCLFASIGGADLREAQTLLLKGRFEEASEQFVEHRSNDHSTKDAGEPAFLTRRYYIPTADGYDERLGGISRWCFNTSGASLNASR